VQTFEWNIFVDFAQIVWIEYYLNTYVLSTRIFAHVNSNLSYLFNNEFYTFVKIPVIYKCIELLIC